MPLATLCHVCRFVFAVILLAGGIAAPAGAVSVSFSLAPATNEANRLTFTISSFGFTDTDTSDVSGSVGGQLELDVSPAGVSVTGLRFDGGQIDATDLDFTFGSLFTVATIEGRNLGGDLVTINPGFSPVSGGQFPTEDHLFVIDEGTLMIESILGDETFDLAADPAELVEEGIATISLQETAASGALRTYLATLMLPVDATTVEGDGSVSATIDVVGNLVATGSFQVNLGLPGDFNEDGTVDAADYTVWRDDFANGQAPASDYQVWRDNYGASSLPLAASSAVAAPEPSLLGSALLLGLVGWRSRQR